MTAANAETVDLLPATGAEPELAGRLVYETDPHIFGYLHGHDRELAFRHLGYQWQQPGGIFSHALATVARLDGRLIGLELGYDRARQQAEVGPFVAQATEYLTAPQFEHLGSWFEYGSYVLPPIPDDAYYLQNLAVVAEARGRGIGERLLEQACERARAAGLARLHLDVYDGNPAVRLYERAGMRVIVETRVPPLVPEGIGLHQRYELNL